MSQKRRIAALAALAVFLVLAAAGCGSSNSGSSSKALVAAADPICHKVAVQREKANAALSAASSSSTQTLKVLAQVAPGVAAIEHSAVSELSNLRQSGYHSKAWQTLLTGMRLLANDTTKLATYAKTKDLGAVHSVIASGKQIRDQLTVIAKNQGFTYCGSTS
jgi:hypothetical protein